MIVLNIFKPKAVFINAIKAYEPYLPAIISFIGAIGSAISTYFATTTLSLIFGFLAGFGALWAVHRQVISSHENRKLTDKIMQLQSKALDYLTGGASFCYASPVFFLKAKEGFIWTFIHSGDVPLSEVSVRICDLDFDKKGLTREQASKTYNLDTLFPGRCHSYNFGDLSHEMGNYNLFFVAKNGGWTQEIRWIWLSNTNFVVANRVFQDGRPITEPLLYKISENFPQILSPTDAWPSLAKANT